MPTFTIVNMQYVTGAGRSRIPRKPASNASTPAGLANIPGVPSWQIPISTGVQISSQPPDKNRQDGDTILNLAFVSLTGCLEGGQSTQSTIDPLKGTVGAADVVQLNVYIPIGGFGPGGGNGALIDAFNVTTGSFVDDVFVNVSPDPTGSITHDANYLGAFSSAHEEAVSAIESIPPSGDISDNIFENWIILAGTGDPSDTISKNNLTVGKNSNVAAFALYQEQQSSGGDDPGYHPDCAKYLPQIYEAEDELNQLVNEYNINECNLTPGERKKRQDVINIKRTTLDELLTAFKAMGCVLPPRRHDGRTTPGSIPATWGFTIPGKN